MEALQRSFGKMYGKLGEIMDLLKKRLPGYPEMEFPQVFTEQLDPERKNGEEAEMGEGVGTLAEEQTGGVSLTERMAKKRKRMKEKEAQIGKGKRETTKTGKEIPERQETLQTPEIEEGEGKEGK
ncbi:hypothetical protein BDZ91DRAFT_796493 [Kalaharituber pfeilii]|nr:hypothetical protein BDZ91DRAFT_796493 [Kalaharituber pfeilii]